MLPFSITTFIPIGDAVCPPLDLMVPLKSSKAVRFHAPPAFERIVQIQVDGSYRTAAQVKVHGHESPG